MRQDVNGLGLGEQRGSYAIAGVGGALLQMARRGVVALAGVVLVKLFVSRPSAAIVKGAVTMAVVLALFDLGLAWNRATARFGISRCYVCAGGLVVTNLFGGVRDAVAWSNVTGLNQTATLSVWLTFHRFEIARNGSVPLAFLALGQKPALATALQSQAAKNGIHR
ncbi:hypothetical protein OHT57_45710 [Streptomyces sp. NBC_00285]|uniref:hypothetical protein n=1 Tax=Streptomyces sp. NBC_00285 TaxID=2975700 RepID=UPI002E294FE1|nr:hypothetical protein [Streptomyces sp. NBC_00285]